MLEGQVSAAYLLLAQVDVLPELGDGVQWGVVLEAQSTDLQGTALYVKCSRYGGTVRLNQADRGYTL